MKLILHIGTEKTGTTTTQHWAARNRDALVRQGVQYSRVLGNNCHTKLHLWCLSPGREDESYQRINVSTSEADREEFRARLKDEFATEAGDARKAGCHTFLISTELCHSRLVRPEEVQRAREFLEPHFDEIEILCGLRPQIDLAVSHTSNIAKGGNPITRAYFDKIGPESTYYNYKTFIERWSDVFGAERMRLVPIRRTPDFTAVVAARAGIDTADLEPPVRSNEAFDIRVMAMTNAMKAGPRAESRWIEPFAYIPRDVLKLLPCEERLQPGLELARSVHARFEETNRDLANSRTDLEMADLEPDWSRYEGEGNLDLLEQPCVFSGELAALVQLFNQAIALAEVHNEVIETERHLDLQHALIARRRLKSALELLALLKKAEIPSQRIRRLQARAESLEKELEGGDRDPLKKERRRDRKPRHERKGPMRIRQLENELEDGGDRDSPRKEHRRDRKPRHERIGPMRSRQLEKELEDGGRDSLEKEHRRDRKPRRERKGPTRFRQPADAV